VSAPDPLDAAAVAVRELVHRTSALRAQALIATADGPAIVSCTRLGPLEVILGERAVELPHDARLDAQAPDLGALRPLPPFEVDRERAEVIGTIGGVDLLADAVARVAEGLGGGAAVVVELETTAPGEPLVLSARAGEPVLVTLGEESYELS
jgi:hypothetical protein